MRDLRDKEGFASDCEDFCPVQPWAPAQVALAMHHVPATKRR